MATRRRFVALAGAAITTAVAGCQSHRQPTPLSLYVYNTAEIATQLKLDLSQDGTTLFTSGDITITPDQPDDRPLFTLKFDSIRAGSEYTVTATSGSFVAQESITADCTDQGGEKVAVQIHDAGELTIRHSSC
jgi:hypothetical protein